MVLTAAYFDTSVLVKRYVTEPGSTRTRTLLRRFHVLSSAVAPVELASAICRRRSAGDVGEHEVAGLLERMATDRQSWELVAVTSLVLGRAETLVRDGTLGTLDAVHVASALTFQTDTGHRLPFVTADARQREAAARLNLEVVWVG